jgi:carbon storage regulator CsrA
MLILSVHEDERIFIGDDIVLTFVRYKSTGGIALGFEAPRDISIDRETVRNSKRLGLRKPEGGTR